LGNTLIELRKIGFSGGYRESPGLLKIDGWMTPKKSLPNDHKTANEL